MNIYTLNNTGNLSYMYRINMSKITAMEDDHNGRWPKWNIISMEDEEFAHLEEVGTAQP